jgi:hypothetical protein
MKDRPTFDDFLEEEGITSEVEYIARQEMIRIQDEKKDKAVLIVGIIVSVMMLALASYILAVWIG